MSDDANRPQRHNEMASADIWNLRRYHQAIRERIGQEFRRRYQPPQDLPHRLLALLSQITNQETTHKARPPFEVKNTGGDRAARHKIRNAQRLSRTRP